MTTTALKPLWLTTTLLIASACAVPASQDHAPALIQSIYWSHGDSGRLDGMSFRLADVDAPDTSHPGHTEGNARWHPNRAGAAVHSGMGRRRSMADDLIDLPWWFAVCLAALVFGVLRYLVPIIQSDNPATLTSVSTASLLAPFPTVALPAIAAPSALKAYRRRRLLARQTSLESIRALPWRTFEHLVSEAFELVDGPALARMIGVDDAMPLTPQAQGTYPLKPSIRSEPSCPLYSLL